MKQVLIIHGGNSFSTYEAYLDGLKARQLNYWKITHPIRWKEHLAESLSDFDVLLPLMPNSANAVYDEWAIYFEKLLALLEDDIQIVGHSLGAMFLAKYLDTHPLATPVRRLILISGGYDDETNEDLGSFKVVSARHLHQSAREIHLFHSQDDPVVPFAELAKFQADLPDAITHAFEDREHFADEYFPELEALLKQK